ncbi:hypothetical protein ACP70R_022836 [Stipagrostis hirtigluma subsp. patula]
MEHGRGDDSGRIVAEHGSNRSGHIVTEHSSDGDGPGMEVAARNGGGFSPGLHAFLVVLNLVLLNRKRKITWYQP